MENEIKEYGYSAGEYSLFRSHAWRMLISFGLTYMFFYNGLLYMLMLVITLAARNIKIKRL